MHFSNCNKVVCTVNKTNDKCDQKNDIKGALDRYHSYVKGRKKEEKKLWEEALPAALGVVDFHNLP